MVFVGQLRRELAAAAAVWGPGRDGHTPGPDGPHVPAGGPLGPVGSGEMAPAPEPPWTGRLPAGHGPAGEPKGVFSGPAVPVRLVPAPGRRAAALDPGPGRALDRRGAPWHRAPAGGHLRPVPASAPHPGRPVSGPAGVRGRLHPDHHPAGGPGAIHPYRLGGLGQPADGAPFGPAGGAGGGGGAAPGPAPVRGGAGDRGGGPRHGGSGAGTAARARVRGALAPAAGGFSGAAPCGGAP